MPLRNLAISPFLDPGIEFEERLPFYDLSSIPGVNELPRELDSFSPPIFIPGGLVYGNEVVDRIYVSKDLNLISKSTTAGFANFY